ncbi:hypothetical protein [Legionella sp. CNM-4043-24]|uniref:hypothetical protein n=1 Tax=Legionella sp. CNM-4043-24 TaxID=3421646 RepID=UPI00403AD15C
MASSSSDLFSFNEQAVSAVERNPETTTMIDSLQFVLCKNGEADERHVLPLVHTPSFDVKSAEIRLPKQDTHNLQSLIYEACRDYNILFRNKSYAISLTSVVAALPGTPAKSDSDGRGATSAEFVPFYNNHNETKRVLVITISEDGIRREHLTLHGGYGYSGRRGLTCLGRDSGPPVALKATEIPNDFADELKQTQPEVYAAMEKNACMVIFIEHDLVQHGVRESADRRPSGGVLQSARIAQSTDIVEQCVGVAQSGAGSRDISRHAAIGDGGAVKDNTRKIREEGIRYLSNVRVYSVQALVVNTQNQPFLAEKCQRVVDLMKQGAQKLNEIYLPHKRFGFEQLTAGLNRHLQPYHITTNHTDIFENTLLKLVGSELNPTGCEYIPHPSKPGYINIRLGISYKDAKILARSLKEMFGEDSCSHGGREYLSMQDISLSLEAISTHFHLILQCIDEQFANPRTVRAYQAYVERQAPIFEQVKPALNKTLATHKLSITSDATEYSLMRMFGCKEVLKYARFQQGSDYVGRKMDIAFFLHISEEEARKLVVNLNQRFPSSFPYARFISATSRLSDMYGINFCEIAIDGGLLCSPEYQSLLLETLGNMAEHEPLLMESLQVASGTRHQQKTSAVHASQMTSLASKYEGSEKQQCLAGPLRFFAQVLTDGRASRTARVEAGNQVAASVAATKASQSADEQGLFKPDRQLIKAARRELMLESPESEMPSRFR